MLKHLECQNGVASILLEFPLHPDLHGVANKKKGGTGETCSDQNERQQELSSQSEVGQVFGHG